MSQRAKPSQMLEETVLGEGPRCLKKFVWRVHPVQKKEKYVQHAQFLEGEVLFWIKIKSY